MGYSIEKLYDLAKNGNPTREEFRDIAIKALYDEMYKTKKEKGVAFIMQFNGSRKPLEDIVTKLLNENLPVRFFGAVLSYVAVDKAIQAWGYQSELEKIQCNNLQLALKYLEDLDQDVELNIQLI